MNKWESRVSNLIGQAKVVIQEKKIKLILKIKYFVEKMKMNLK